ncbi:hypothetical protein AAFF_G00420080 [Aldrovandia affinis]|uniref:Secreted protein n=1 Tax=Aldrovandia affinis TaxID=143900 RepID=A0AAD7SCF7_9TELE|nr:hypothetical protein AAFF_G00420080 [Aldrovandia affinis]
MGIAGAVSLVWMLAWCGGMSAGLGVIGGTLPTRTWCQGPSPRRWHPTNQLALVHLANPVLDSLHGDRSRNPNTRLGPPAAAVTMDIQRKLRGQGSCWCPLLTTDQDREWSPKNLSLREAAE